MTNSAPVIVSSASTPQSRLDQISAQMSTTTTTSFSPDAVPQAPEDPLFGLMAAFRRDSDKNKVDLGIGAYRDNNAKPWVLPVVRKAKEIVATDPDGNHEYLPISGLPEFTSASQKLIFGASSSALSDSRTVSLQTISGTGAVHLGALFLARFYSPSASGAKTIYLSDPTWANHHQIFSNVHLPIKSYLEDADKQLYGLQQRAIAASTAAPSVTSYFRALFASGNSVFSSSPSARTTKKGVIVTGAHGEFRLAVGADEQLLPGRGGPSAEYEKRKALIEEAKKQKSHLVGGGQSLLSQAEAALGSSRDQVGELSSTLKKQQRKEAAASGWKSAAFDC